MIGYPKSTVIDNVFTLEEIHELAEYFALQPVAHHYKPQNTFNKNLDYHIPGSLVDVIIKPRLAKILNDPDHTFFGGSYKEYTIPYQPHIDNTLATASMVFDFETKHQTAFLIPLMEDERLKTVMFDVFMPRGHKFNLKFSEEDKVESLSKFLQDHDTGIDIEEFSHIKEPMKSILPRIPIDNVVTWKLGSVITWHFDQLHCSTDFARYGITKKFIVIMIN